ncbi:MAG TPA: mechanosensitive ion channel family protein [Caulobacteraceae bacterium]|nr:mechanosensitive ion channel family protein [Caulobacteraceae bacterium]
MSLILAAADGPPPQPIDAIRAGVHAAIAGGPDNWRSFFDDAGALAVNLVVAGAIFALTLWAARVAAGLVRRAVGRVQRPGAKDPTLQGFLGSLARWVVIVLGVMAVLEQLGVRTTSILAVVGAASIAIGLAMQGALGNVAAGVMLLVLRPYRVGDVVEIDGRTGTVQRLDLFMTELADADNLAIYVPNGKAFGDVVINYSSPKTRRMELDFPIDYGEDQGRAQTLLIECAKADARILKTPAPWSKTTALGEHAVTVTLRCWVRPEVYWEARFDLIERATEALLAAGFEHPYPHQVAVTKAPKPAGS